MPEQEGGVDAVEPEVDQGHAERHLDTTSKEMCLMFICGGKEDGDTSGERHVQPYILVRTLFRFLSRAFNYEFSV